MTFTAKLMMAAAAIGLSAAAHAQMATSPSDYVMKAGAADQYEIQSSRLVMKSTSNPRVKSFANKMIQDHTKSTAMVKKAAMKAGMTPPAPMLDADGQQMMSQLEAASGTERDKLYMQQQMTAHEKALALQQDYAEHGDSKPLKSAASMIVPVVRTHETLLKNMAPM